MIAFIVVSVFVLGFLAGAGISNSFTRRSDPDTVARCSGWAEEDRDHENDGGLCIANGDYTCSPNPKYCNVCSIKKQPDEL